MTTQLLNRLYSKSVNDDGALEVDFDLDIFPDDIDDIDDMGATMLGGDISDLLTEHGHLNLQEIADGFAVMGVPVGVRALRHNFSAWLGDMKSGYLDTDHGCFVFTPCGCNPLSFRVQEVKGEPKDYQKTYEC